MCLSKVNCFVTNLYCYDAKDGSTSRFYFLYYHCDYKLYIPCPSRMILFFTHIYLRCYYFYIRR